MHSMLHNHPGVENTRICMDILNRLADAERAGTISDERRAGIEEQIALVPYEGERVEFYERLAAIGDDNG